MSPSQSAPYGAASSPIGGAKGCVGSGTLNNNLSFCWGKPAGTKHFLSRRQKTVEFLKNICYNTLNQTCRISSLVEWSLPKPQRRVRFPYPAPPQNDLLRQVVFLLLQGQHRAMGAADFGGSFVPIVQYKKWEIHTVFPHFSYFRLEQNLSPNLLTPLRGVAQELSLYFSGGLCYNDSIFSFSGHAVRKGTFTTWIT